MMSPKRGTGGRETPSRRIDDPVRDHVQRRQAGHEEVVPTASLHEPRDPAAKVRWLSGVWIALDQETPGVFFVIAEQRVLVVRAPKIVAVVDPLLLDELELARDVCAQRHEDDAVFALVVR